MVKRDAYFPYREFIPKTKRKEKYENIILHIEFFLEVISDEERSSKT